MRVYFSTVIRSAPIEYGGEIIILDWDNKKILNRKPIVPDNPKVIDPNPRGGTRGGRGILKIGNELFVACYHSIYVYDLDLTLLRTLSNPLFVGIHEMATDGKSLWVTSTTIDTLVQVDFDGITLQYWCVREDEYLKKELGIKSQNINFNEDNRLRHIDSTHYFEPSHAHLNAVYLGNNDIYVTMHSFGTIAKLNPTKILIRDKNLKGCHNIHITEDGLIIVNDSITHSIRVYSLDGEIIRTIWLMDFMDVKIVYWRSKIYMHLSKIFLSKKYFSRPLFVRGLSPITNERILVGVSPCGILDINYRTGILMDYYFLSNDTRVCVHGLLGEFP